MVSTPICLLNTDTGMENPFTGSFYNKVESQLPLFYISHGSRCSVNELEGTVGIRIPTTSSVAKGGREVPAGRVLSYGNLRVISGVDVGWNPALKSLL